MLQKPDNQDQGPAPLAHNAAKKGEIAAWASYDIANSTFGTIIATAVYNAYFVKVVAGENANGTFLLSLVICISSLLIVLSAPIVGTICDAKAAKKHLLLVSTAICIVATAALSFAGPGAVALAMTLLTTAYTAFGTGENLLAAFLPELATSDKIGRISAIGWAAGYVGGLFSLGTCLLYVQSAEEQHIASTHYVPQITVAVAILFAVLSVPTFVFLKERALPDRSATNANLIRLGFSRLKKTIGHVSLYKDLARYLVTLFLYSCGASTIIHLASVYAQKEFGFTTMDSVGMILLVNVTAAIGSWTFGIVQDKFGSVRTLFITLSIWSVAVFSAYLAHSKTELWLIAVLIGVAMGSTGSIGRALVGKFSPAGRSGEFLGLWGMASKLATATGVLSFGAVTYATHENYRIAMLSTAFFFIAGIAMLCTVNEKRGCDAALVDIASSNVDQSTATTGEA